MSDLTLSSEMIDNVGVAANAGGPLLLYGPSGNGKTSIGRRIGRMFKDVIYVPYAFEVDGQMIKVFEPALHRPIEAKTADEPIGLRREGLDDRWVACSRPFVVRGGELSLEMLDLGWAGPGLYEAPPQVKALGGVMMLDDFGRQIVSPKALLNRWIVPLESGVDYLTLRTGKAFALPFDALVIFSTNLTPTDLMDPAFLRRLPHKIEAPAPSREDFKRIFRLVAQRCGVAASDQSIDAVMEALASRTIPLASYQPEFFVQQAVAVGKFEGGQPAVSRELIARAIHNL